MVSSDDRYERRLVRAMDGKEGTIVYVYFGEIEAVK